MRVPDYVISKDSPITDGGEAAYGMALALAVKALTSLGQPSIGEPKPTFTHSIAVVFAIYIYVLFSNYLKHDGLQIRPHSVASGFANLFANFSKSDRAAIENNGLEMFKRTLARNSKTMQEWHDNLSKTIQIWLISATSSKRTPQHDQALQQILELQLKTLHDTLRIDCDPSIPS